MEILERRACITGIGQSEVGRRLGRDPLELSLDACLDAIRDAVPNSIMVGDSTQLIYAGNLYYLANADAKKMFEAKPEKYHVAYDGYCATAMAMGRKLESDPTLFAVEGGVTYRFSSADAKKMFDEAPADYIKKADTQWASLSKK